MMRPVFVDVIGISLALVFMILFSRDRSAALALIIMGDVPLAPIGSVVALCGWSASRSRWNDRVGTLQNVRLWAAGQLPQPTPSSHSHG